MKKFLSLFLAVLMVASVVAMMPVFTVSAAEETMPDLSGLTKIDGNISFGTGHGFLDGASRPVDTENHDFSKLTGETDDKAIRRACKIYVDGKRVYLNDPYTGNMEHTGVNGGGIWWGIVGAGYTAGVESTITVIIGDSYYMEKTFTPGDTAHYVVDAKTTYYSETKGIVSIVEFETLPNLDQEIKLEFHDEHIKYNTVVKAVEGNTVTFLTEGISTDKTLCEYSLADGSRFSCTVNKKAMYTPTFEATGYVQVRPNEENTFGAFDVRVLAEAYEPYLADYTSAKIALSVTNGGVTKTFEYATTTVYKTITAGSETLTAEEGRSYFGVVVKNIPNGATSVSASLILEGEETVTMNLGSATLDNPYADLDEKTGDAIQKGECLGIENQTVDGERLKVVTYAGFDDMHQTWINEGGTVILNIDGTNYVITRAGWYGTYYARLVVDGFEFVDGQTYAFKLYVFDANYNLVYYNGKTSSNKEDLRVPANVTLPEGLTQVTDVSNVTSSGIGTYGGEGVECLFDGKYTDGNHSKICGSVSGQTFTVSFNTTSATELTHYSFVTANDTAGTSRNPVAWTLYGKVNGEWVVLSRVTANAEYYTGLQAVNYTPFSYEIDNVQSCSEYKIEFVRNGNPFQLAEILLYQ